MFLEWEGSCSWRAIVKVINLKGRQDDCLKEAYLRILGGRGYRDDHVDEASLGEVGARSTQDALQDYYQEVTESVKAESRLEIFQRWLKGERKEPYREYCERRYRF